MSRSFHGPPHVRRSRPRICCRSDACLTANHTSALLTESLAARLAGSARMAGDDATSGGFSRTYDGAAAEALAALADLTHAFTLVEQQRSPEVPLAVEALAELTTVIGDTGADHRNWVDDIRRQIRTFLSTTAAAS